MLQRLAALAACAAITAQLLRASWDATVCVEPGDGIPKLEAPRGDDCWVAVNSTVGAKWAAGYLGACASQDFDDANDAPLTINAATPWTLHCAAVSSCRWHARRRGDELAVCSGGRLASVTHFVATRLLGKCQLPWEAYMTWFARAPGDAVETPRGIDHVPCGGVAPWRPPDRQREALVSAVWNRTRVAFGR